MMPIFDPKDLALWGRAVWNQEPKNRIEGFSIDTRSLGQGQMFVALKDKRDGHEFLDIAESDGATGALVAKCNHNLSLPQLLADIPNSLQVLLPNIERFSLVRLLVLLEAVEKHRPRTSLAYFWNR